MAGRESSRCALEVGDWTRYSDGQDTTGLDGVRNASRFEWGTCVLESLIT